MIEVVPGSPRLPAEGEFKLPLLVSYAYLRDVKPETKNWLLNEAAAEGFEVLLDSGAFSASNAGHEISLSEYIDFLHEWKHSFANYLLLDVLGDPKQTAANMITMMGEGLEPVPVHVLGDDERRMDELFESSSLVALGGFRRPGRGPAPKNYVSLKMKWAKGRDVHWLGYTYQDMLLALKPYSCDCSNYTYADQYGQIQIYLGNGRFFNTKRPRRSEPVPLAVRKIVQRAGYSEADWADNEMWYTRAGSNGEDIISMSARLTIDSWVRYVMDLRQHQGTRLFLATVLIPTQIEPIRECWATLKKEFENDQTG